MAMSITFKDLQNFVVVAQSETLSEASEKLEMAQPSLSLGIKKLETELDQILFIRSRTGIKLTPVGKKLLPKAEKALLIMGDILGDQSNLRFKIGCHPSVGMYLLGSFLKFMHKDNPKIDFDVANFGSAEINKMVASGELDFGAVMNPLPIQGLVTRFIGEDDVHVWESKDRYQDKLIYNPELMQSRSIISRWKECPGETVEVSNLELIASLVASGAGYGILPAQVVKSQRLNLKIVSAAPSFKDKLAIVCYPEMLKTTEGKLIFENLKKSFQS
jgi:DNA-binding transcriptional LysR family regulator